MGTSFRRFLKVLDTGEQQITEYFWLTQFFLRYYDLKRNFKKLDKTQEGEETGYEIIASSIDLDPIRFLIRRIEQHGDEVLSLPLSSLLSFSDNVFSISFLHDTEKVDGSSCRSQVPQRNSMP